MACMPREDPRPLIATATQLQQHSPNQLPLGPLPSNSLHVSKYLALSAQPQAFSQPPPAEDTAPAFSQPPPAALFSHQLLEYLRHVTEACKGMTYR